MGVELEFLLPQWDKDAGDLLIVYQPSEGLLTLKKHAGMQTAGMYFIFKRSAGSGLGHEVIT